MKYQNLLKILLQVISIGGNAQINVWHYWVLDMLVHSRSNCQPRMMCCLGSTTKVGSVVKILCLDVTPEVRSSWECMKTQQHCLITMCNVLLTEFSVKISRNIWCFMLMGPIMLKLYSTCMGQTIWVTIIPHHSLISQHIHHYYSLISISCIVLYLGFFLRPVTHIMHVHNASPCKCKVIYQLTKVLTAAHHCIKILHLASKRKIRLAK